MSYLPMTTACFLALMAVSPVAAQNAEPTEEEIAFGATADRFLERSGEAIYQTACEGCHMPNGEGAAGAGDYPALADNARLMAASYPLHLVVRGRGAMPSFADWLDDQQIAEVVAYIQTNFGNDFEDATPTVEQVAEIRRKESTTSD